MHNSFEAENCSLLQSLFDADTDFDKLMRSHGIRVSYAPLGREFWGIVYYSRKGIYHLVIYSNLSSNIQKRVFLHEIKYIIFDAPKND